jgi:hypothetical protein
VQISKTRKRLLGQDLFHGDDLVIGDAELLDHLLHRRRIGGLPVTHSNAVLIDESALELNARIILQNFPSWITRTLTSWKVHRIIDREYGEHDLRRSADPWSLGKELFPLIRLYPTFFKNILNIKL